MTTRTRLSVLLRVLVGLLILGIAVPVLHQILPARAAGATISSATYRDKTTAGLLSEIAGVLTGYEFVRSTRSATPNNPTSPLPDSWYQNGSFDDLVNGPYSGNNPNWQPTDAEHHRLTTDPNTGAPEVLSYDNYQTDIFNQYILHDYGANPSAQNIRDEWSSHQVSDWGGGQEAYSLAAQGVLPPFTGQSEWNWLYWCTEPYIENDTLGMDAPGMPATTWTLTQKFASVTGEGDNVIWAKFIATMESLAYTDTSGDIRNVMAQAASVLPQNSWPYQEYQIANTIHNQTSDWHSAITQMQTYQRQYYGQDDFMATPDPNNAFLVLAILYGNNDYETTAKIAALTNFDAEDQTGAVLAIMGILKGMNGIPQVVKDKLYANGTGEYGNDPSIRPHIGANYPTTQTWDSIVSLYQSNAEAEITANGGSVSNGTYYLPDQSVLNPSTVLINNYDFEQGNLNGWQTSPAPDGVHVYAQNNGTAQSGNWKGTLYTDGSVPEAKMWVHLTNLQAGAIYRLSAFIQGDAEARLFVDNWGGSFMYASSYGTASPADTGAQASPPDPNAPQPHNGYWQHRDLYFVPSGSTADVGLDLPNKGTHWAAIDNLMVEQVTNNGTTRYEAESSSNTISGGQVLNDPSASGGSYVGNLNDVGSYLQFNNVNAPSTGEYRVAIAYSNGYANARMNLYVNGNYYATLLIPRSGDWGQFAQTTLEVPVVLQGGSNTIKIQKDDSNGNFAQYDYIDVSSPIVPVNGSSVSANN